MATMVFPAPHMFFPDHCGHHVISYISIYKYIWTYILDLVKYRKQTRKKSRNKCWMKKIMKQLSWSLVYNSLRQCLYKWVEINFLVWISPWSLMNFSMNDPECLKIQMGSELIILPYFLVDKAFPLIQSRQGLHSGLLAVLGECWVAPISWKFVTENIWWILEYAECIRIKSEFICKWFTHCRNLCIYNEQFNSLHTHSWFIWGASVI